MAWPRSASHLCRRRGEVALNLVASSAWLEHFAGSTGAGSFAPAVEDAPSLLVPSIVLHEVFRRILQQRSEGEALSKYVTMVQAHVVPLNDSLAINAARLSCHTGLPMADNIILATAQAYQATIWRQDRHFSGLPNVRYFQKSVA